MLTCRQWKVRRAYGLDTCIEYGIQDIAASILYNTIELNGPYMAILLAQTLRASLVPLASGIRVLVVHDYVWDGSYGDEETVANSLLAIFVRAVNLETLSLPEYHRSGDMEVISQISRFSLQILDLSVKDQSWSSLPLVGSFINLTCLKIGMFGEGHMPNNSPAWNLPCLTALHIGCSDLQDASFVSFLCLCSFEGLKELDYRAHMADVNHLDAFSRLLKCFDSLESLRLATATDHIHTCISASIETLTLETWNDLKITLIPSTLTKPVLSVEYRHQTQAVWDILDLVLEKRGRLQQIRIQSNYSSMFRWVFENPELLINNDALVSPSKFTTRLLSYAAKLAPLGIDLLDDEGKTVFDYFPR
jgi:hypothetical protein